MGLYWDFAKIQDPAISANGLLVLLGNTHKGFMRFLAHASVGLLTVRRLVFLSWQPPS